MLVQIHQCLTGDVYSLRCDGRTVGLAIKTIGEEGRFVDLQQEAAASGF
jgi:hypothetical protein